MTSFSDRLERLFNLTGTGITLVTGIPAVITFVGTAWAYFAKLPILAVFLIALFCLLTSLWIAIGLFAVLNTARFIRRQDLLSRNYDPVAWGLDIIELNLLQVNDFAHREFLLRGTIRSRFGFPLRTYIEECSVKINSVAPEIEPFPRNGVIIPGQTLGMQPSVMSLVHFNPGLLSLQNGSEFSGKAVFRIIYGYPDAGYTQRMHREYNLFGKLTLPPAFMAGMPHSIVRKVAIIEDESPISSV